MAQSVVVTAFQRVRITGFLATSIPVPSFNPARMMVWAPKPGHRQLA